MLHLQAFYNELIGQDLLSSNNRNSLAKQENSSKNNVPAGTSKRIGGQNNRNGRSGFDTDADEMMIGVSSTDVDVRGNAIEVTTDAIFTVGETIGDYTPPGILDGLGAYKLKGNTVRVLANHELSSSVGYAYDIQDVSDLTGSRISYFDIDIKTRTVVDAGLAYNTIYILQEKKHPMDLFGH